MNKTLQGYVLNALIKNPKFRDSDTQLCAYIWMQYEDTDCMAITGSRLLNLIDDKQISSLDTISRVRRKIQSKFPATRGNIYEKRHDYQAKVKEDLGYGRV
jgi:hypothetical protein